MAFDKMFFGDQEQGNVPRPKTIMVIDPILSKILYISRAYLIGVLVFMAFFLLLRNISSHVAFRDPFQENYVQHTNNEEENQNANFENET